MSSLQIECLESRIKAPRQLYSKFAIAPLKQAQGITIGNALRRVLLGDLEGLAIVSARIAGINHEFSTIPGVREDVLEVLLNLKEIVLIGEVGESQIGRLRVQGPAIVTAAQFELPPQVELVDPRQYIATISSNDLLEMEFTIKAGSGYNLVERSSSDSSIDSLQVDAVFMPIQKVNYYVEENKLEGDKFQEKLIIEIYTNGSITPQKAIIQASEILTYLFNPLRTINLTLESPEEKDIYSRHKLLSIEELNLSVRAYNCLKRSQIHSIADLLNYTREDLLEIRNFGQKSADEVVQALKDKLDLELPKEKSGYVKIHETKSIGKPKNTTKNYE
uniref:DNA-directed RNA polymerase subunit alpha n=1 Tax=Gronococcus sybilensis TaxID=3028029 RepID=A0A9Y1I2P6_9RHOD|nr:RNA polymerase alpha subunit [Gronococcus sybilensis]